jgi:hypothetical protein
VEKVQVREEEDGQITKFNTSCPISLVSSCRFGQVSASCSALLQSRGIDVGATNATKQYFWFRCELHEVATES